MQHPDLRHHARDRIVAAEVMKLDLHEADRHAARGEPGVIATRKPRRAAARLAKRALACQRAPAMRRVEHAPEDAALYQCHCGHSFTAAVTADVDCPSCGTGQPW